MKLSYLFLSRKLEVVNEFFLKTFFPYECEFCREQLNYLDDIRICRKCVSKLLPNQNNLCKECAHPLTNLICLSCEKDTPLLKNHKTLLLYSSIGKELIHKYKFEKKKSFSRTIIKLILENHLDYFKEFDVIVPVTIASKDYFDRDFCPVLTVCKEVANRTKVKIIKPISKKSKQKAQHHKNRMERKAEITKQFKVLKKKMCKLNNKKVLIIDDVYTTGSTLNIFYQHIISHSSPTKVNTFSFARSVFE